ncbi:MAG TPA: phosphoribosyl transferase [Oceanithermus profundus]|uniref:Phosphoribosyl transferase n=1 Tax=Oceanithermus profundus TaxID=187137 RepID=A0A7C4V667_9DEIN|nr:phosphoribosyl transferase [Oceanithermus profundus]
MFFEDRAHAARLLAGALEPLGLSAPVVLGIPRGGVVLADVIARELGGTMDVVLARKIGAPGNPEYALGAVGEDGQVFLQPYAERVADPAYLKAEIARQMQVIRERRRRYRAVRPKEPLAGRDVVLTDDGIATGSTMEAALTAVQAEEPARVVVAVPVGPPEAVERLRQRVEVVALSTPPDFVAVGAYYRSFPQVSDDEVEKLLAAWAVE